MRKLPYLFLVTCLLVTCQGLPQGLSDTPHCTPRVAVADTLVPTSSLQTPTPTPFSGPWQLVAVHNVHHSVMTAGFLNENFAITGGVVGYMFFTTDGGKTWQEGVNSSDCRYGMDIVNSTIAWTCGGMMHVRRSMDGGRTWQAVTDFGQDTTKPCHTISFLDGETGWLATLYMLGSTVDGGTTWSMLPQPEGVDDIASIDLYAPGKGYLLDFSGTLFATQDNGAHWNTVTRLEPGDLVIPKAAYQMVAMRFQDANHGLIVISEEYRIGRVVAFHTADGGITWTSESVPVTSGPLFLSRELPLLTVITGPNIMTVLLYKGE